MLKQNVNFSLNIKVLIMTVASVKTVVEGLPELSQVKQKMPNFKNLTFQEYTQRKIHTAGNYR